MESDESRTVGVLYCGDLGTALGNLLVENGMRVVSTCEGRSSATINRASESPIEILDSLDEVVSISDVLISLVQPDSAIEIAREVANRKLNCKADLIFVDANSISPEQATAIDEVLAGSSLNFVDAAIHGSASRLRDLGVLYVSGKESANVAQLFQNILRVVSLGEKIGQASKMKLLMGGLSKGLNMLFLEMAINANQNGMLEAYLVETQTFYPEIRNVIDRMLPTYPVHGARRVTELESVENLARSVNAPISMIHGARKILLDACEKWDSACEDVFTIVQRASNE